MGSTNGGGDADKSEAEVDTEVERMSVVVERLHTEGEEEAVDKEQTGDVEDVDTTLQIDDEEGVEKLQTEDED